MPLPRRTPPLPKRVQLEAEFFVQCLRSGYLAASYQAACLADPCVCAGPEVSHEPPILFSDIPDIHFRKIKDILPMSHAFFAGGIKS